MIGVMWLGTMIDGILKPKTHYSYPTHSNIGPFVGNMVSGTAHALLMIAFMIVIAIGFYGGIYIGLPIALLFLLFLLPGVFYDATVRLPVIAWQWLRYLTVPHPAEAVYLAGIRGRVPRDELAANVADAVRNDAIIAFKRLPPAWKSRNMEKRIAALCKKVKAMNDFAQEVKRRCCD